MALNWGTHRPRCYLLFNLVLEIHRFYTTTQIRCRSLRAIFRPLISGPRDAITAQPIPSWHAARRAAHVSWHAGPRSSGVWAQNSPPRKSNNSVGRENYPGMCFFHSPLTLQRNKENTRRSSTTFPRRLSQQSPERFLVRPRPGTRSWSQRSTRGRGRPGTVTVTACRQVSKQFWMYLNLNIAAPQTFARTFTKPGSRLY